jgi:hypothetical protein
MGSEGATGSGPALLAVRVGAEIERGPNHQVLQVLSDCRVRAARLVQTGGGSFTNLSQALRAQVP